MSVSIEYSFSYEDQYPRVHMISSLDGEVVSNVIIDLSLQYEAIPTEVLQDFSDFLLNQFNLLIQEILDDNLNIDLYNRKNEELKTLCRMKTGCDKVIYERENPVEVDNYIPPLNELVTDE